MRKTTAIATAAAVVLTSTGFAASPAEARGRYGYGGWGYRHHDRIDAGDVIGGLLIIGTIAAIATAASKDRRDRRDRDWRYDPPYRDSYPNDDRRDAPRYRPQEGGDTAYSSTARSEAEARAADACSWAVEGEMGDDARVDSISETRPDGGGWYVTGTASRLGGDVRGFDCSYRNGRVVDVRFR